MSSIIHYFGDSVGGIIPVKNLSQQTHSIKSAHVTSFYNTLVLLKYCIYFQENKEANAYTSQGDSKRNYHPQLCYSTSAHHSPCGQDSSYYQRLPYRQSYQPYPGQSQSPIAAMGVAKGMVMMCTNQRLLGTYEHSGVVTGTFYPPVATSQEQPSPGYATPTSRSFLSGYSTATGLPMSSPSAHYTSCASPGSSMRTTESYQGWSVL